MKETATKADLELWDLAKKKALKKMHGIHSARAMQLAVKYYKDMGGTYIGRKTGKEKLAKWTKEKWTTSPGTEKIARRSGTTARYLPEKAWKKLTKSQQIATDLKKRKSSRGKKQAYVKNTKAAEVAGKLARRYKAVIESKGNAKKPNVLIDKNPSKSYSGNISENIVIINYGNSNMLKFFGHYENTFCAILFDTPENASIYRNKVSLGNINPPIFHRQRAGMLGAGTLDVFIKQNKKEAKGMIAAYQGFPLTDKLIITHMIVLPSYRRSRINTIVIDSLKKEYGLNNVMFEEPTDLGFKFMKNYGGTEFKK